MKKHEVPTVRAAGLIAFVRASFDPLFSSARFSRWMDLGYFSPERPGKRPVGYTLGDLVAAAFISQTIKLVDMQNLKSLVKTLRRMVNDAEPDLIPIGDSTLILSGGLASTKDWEPFFIDLGSPDFEDALASLDRRLLILPVGLYYERAVEFLTKEISS